jgi:hypothetical protein
MAFLTKKEFAERCGMNTKNLAVYKKNGKVVYTDDGRLNDQIEPNKSFLETYSQKALAKKGVKELRLIRPPRPEEMEEGFIEAERKIAEEKDEDLKESLSYAALQKKKLEEQVEKLKNENRKLKLGNEKVVGNYVPTDQVRLILIQFGEAIHLAWENEMEERDGRLAAKYKLDREQITELRSDRNNSVNITKERALKNAKTMLRRLQNETSDKREVGEHD